MEHMDLLRCRLHDGSALLGNTSARYLKRHGNACTRALRRVAYNYMLEVPG